MHRLSRSLLAAALLVLTPLAACNQRSATGGTVRVYAVFTRDLQVGEVTRIVVDVYKDPAHQAFAPAIEYDLGNTNGTWSGVRSNVPAGTWIFAAQAYNAQGVRLYHGEGPGIVRSNTLSLVTITIQQDQLPGSSDNHAPIIDSLTASATGVDYGESVVVSATAHDPDDADNATLAYAWTSDLGSFSGPADGLSATWVAPPGPTPATATLTFTVTDQHQSFSAQSFTIAVSPATGQAGAEVTATINTWPDMDSVTISPTQVPIGGVVTLAAAAHDNDGDVLTWQWSKVTCQGNFLSPATQAQTTFQPSATATQNPCQLKATVTDGRGGTNYATIMLYVSTPAAVTFPPLIEDATQSDAAAYINDTVLLSIKARDPSALGAAITYTWVPHNGTMGSPTFPSTNKSAVTFKPNNCQGESYVTVTAKNSNGNATVDYRFDIANCAPTCKELKLRDPSLIDGQYVIDPDGDAGGNPALLVYCDMTTDGGGWTFFAFQRSDYAAESFFNGVFRNYSPLRVRSDSYSIGGNILPIYPDTEMMISVDAANPVAASANHSLIFYRHAPDLATFQAGPYACNGGGNIGYRFDLSGPYLPGYIGLCSTPSWYPYDEHGRNLVLTDHDAGGAYLGEGMDPVNHAARDWGHDAWYYVR